MEVVKSYEITQKKLLVYLQKLSQIISQIRENNSKCNQERFLEHKATMMKTCSARYVLCQSPNIQPKHFLKESQKKEITYKDKLKELLLTLTRNFKARRACTEIFQSQRTNSFNELQ